MGGEVVVGDEQEVMFVSRVVARLKERLIVTQVRRIYNLYQLGIWAVCKLSSFLVQFYSRVNGNEWVILTTLSVRRVLGLIGQWVMSVFLCL